MKTLTSSTGRFTAEQAHPRSQEKLSVLDSQGRVVGTLSQNSKGEPVVNGTFFFGPGAFANGNLKGFQAGLDEFERFALRAEAETGRALGPEAGKFALLTK